jgi:hypothetical protein
LQKRVVSDKLLVRPITLKGAYDERNDPTTV